MGCCLPSTMNRFRLSATRRNAALVLLPLIMLTTWSADAAAATRFAVANGNWGLATRWSAAGCGGASGASFPTAADDVTICNGVTITVDAAGRAASSLTLETGANTTRLNFAAGSSLAVSNNVAINLPTAAVTKRIDVATGTLTVGGNVTLTGGAAANRDALLTVSSGAITINGGLNINATVAGSSTVSITNAAGTISVSGAAGVTNGDRLTIGAGSFSMPNLAATLTTRNASVAATTSVTSGTLTVAGNVLTDSGLNGASVLSVTSGQVSIGGKLDVTAAAATANGGDATVTVSTGRIDVTGNVTVTGGSNNARDALLRVTGASAVGQGVNIGGTLNIVSGTSGSATVSTTNAGSRITINGAGGVNNGDSLTVDVGLVSLTNPAAKLTTLGAGVTATTSVTSGTLTVAGDVVVDSGTSGLSRLTVTTGLVTIGGKLDVTAAAATANSGDATVSVTSGRVDVTGNVTVTGGSNANRDALLTVTGNSGLSNGINIGGALSVVSSSAGSATVYTSNAGSRVTVNGFAGVNNGDYLQIDSGIFRITNGGLTNSNAGVAAQVRLTTGTLSVTGSLTNASGETLRCNAACTILLAGNFASDGSFIPNAGTVTLSGSAAQTISGTDPVTFNNLTIANGANPNLTLATNVVVSGTLTGTATLTSTCPIDYTLTSPGPTVLHSCISAAGFNAFEPPTLPTTCATLPVATATGSIKTKVAGTTYSLCVVALDITPKIETSFNNAVKVEVVGNYNTGVALDANNCPTTLTVLDTIPSATLTNGRASVSFNAVPNAWRDVRVRVSYPAVAPTLIKCSLDNYAMRPASLGVAVTDGDWETAGIARALNNGAAPGGNVHKAGRPFTITATARNGAGVPVVTTNYAGTPTAGISSYLIPTACINGTGCTLNGGTFTDGTANDGIVSASDASYAEVGAFNMLLTDTSFASVDAGDSSAAERDVTSTPVATGRFVPDHFTLAAASRTPACGNMNYMGQPFGVVATLEARNFADAKTENYQAASGGYAPAIVAWQAENLDNGTNLGARLVNAGASWAGGVYAVNSTTAAFNRLASPVVDGAFDSLQLGVQLSDPDGPLLTGLNMDAGSSGACAPCTAATVGAPIIERYGRLRLLNAYGSELLPLRLPLRAEYFNGTSWALNTLDNCTSLPDNVIALSGGISANTSAAAVASLNAGRGTLTLAKPGPVATGSVDVALNLGAAGTDSSCNAVPPPSFAGNRQWLQFPWCAGKLDPNARVKFGSPKAPYIYLRERY